MTASNLPYEPEFEQAYKGMSLFFFFFFFLWSFRFSRIAVLPLGAPPSELISFPSALSASGSRDRFG